MHTHSYNSSYNAIRAIHCSTCTCITTGEYSAASYSYNIVSQSHQLLLCMHMAIATVVSLEYNL